jgi:hypothetical protein
VVSIGTIIVTVILPEEAVSLAVLNPVVLGLNSNPEASKYESYVELCYYRLILWGPVLQYRHTFVRCILKDDLEYSVKTVKMGVVYFGGLLAIN